MSPAVGPAPGRLAALLGLGRGRLVPLLLLVLAGLTLFHIERTPLAELQAGQFDRYQRLAPRERHDEPVIVVGIDSQSLVDYGQWPWPRDIIARLLARIGEGRPLAVGIDAVFAERDQTAPARIARRLPADQAALLAGLPDPDKQLARALAATPTVLATVGLSRELPGARLPIHPLPLFRHDPALEPRLPQYPSALSSLDLLQQAAAGEGLINATPGRLSDHADRGVVRRVPTVALLGQRPLLSLPLEMVRQALGGGEVEAEGDTYGMRAIRIGDYRLPTQANGEVFLHYGRSTANYYLSARDLLNGDLSPDIFADRFVIVGLLGTGLQDRVITPLGDNLPGVDVHVQVIESLLDQHALRRPAWLPTLELATLLIAGLLLIGSVPVLRPRLAGLTFVLLAGAIVGAGYLAFLAGNWLFDGASIALLLAPPFIALLANTLIAADLRRRAAERDLQRSREEAARIAGELGAARSIQMGMLPDPAKVLQGDPRIDAAAILEPALAVGGDYYDCFRIDARRLCLAVADVSGKGLPASLFMAIAKALSGVLMRRHGELGKAAGDIEIELSRENPSSLFVTAFIAVLDLDSGEMEYICAGHDAPLLLRAGEIQRIDTSTVAGPPLCALGDYPYETGRIALQPGDTLCLFTDGVSEASDGNALFGSERLGDLLRQLPPGDVDLLCCALRDAVRRFEAGLPAADDLTLLVARWQGRPAN